MKSLLVKLQIFVRFDSKMFQFIYCFLWRVLLHVLYLVTVCYYLMGLYWFNFMYVLCVYIFGNDLLLLNAC